MNPKNSTRKNRRIGYGVFGLTLVVSLVLVVYLLRSGGPPEQPIAYPHDVHVTKDQIPCLYCHSYASVSTEAGVPSVKKCMLCHLFQAIDKEEVKKIKEYWDNQEKIPWKRIHTLPDPVYFSHKRHVNAGMQCQECHGPVQDMKVMVQYSSLEMGWCLDCHRVRGASVDCLACHQ